MAISHPVTGQKKGGVPNEELVNSLKGGQILVPRVRNQSESLDISLLPLGGSFGQGSRTFWPKGEPFFEGSNTFGPFLLVLVHEYNE